MRILSIAASISLSEGVFLALIPPGLCQYHFDLLRYCPLVPHLLHVQCHSVGTLEPNGVGGIRGVDRIMRCRSEGC